jgi:SAM-dependent methyltransferase
MRTRTFGRYQATTSDAIRRLGMLGQLYSGVVGMTDVPSYGRFLWFCHVLRRLPAGSITRVMDAGSGMGDFAAWMAEEFPHAHILGVEISAERIRRSERVRTASGLTNLTFEQADLRHLEYEKEFDFIYSVDVFEHIAENRDVICRCHHALRPGGHLLIRIPTERQERMFPDKWFARLHEWSKDEHVGQHFDLEGLSDAMRSAGLEIVEAIQTSGIAGRLGFELSYLLNEYAKPVYAIAIPLLKGLYWADVWTGPKRQGNGIVVLARRPLNPTATASS